MSGCFLVKHLKYRRIIIIAISFFLVFLAIFMLQWLFRATAVDFKHKKGAITSQKLVARRRSFEAPASEDYHQPQENSSYEEDNEKVMSGILPESGCYFRSQSGKRKFLPRALLLKRKCKQRLPEILIIGAKKCGTGALVTFLSYHPDLAAPRSGEVHFFEKLWRKSKVPSSEYKLWMAYSSTINGYTQIAIEKTPSYFMHPDVPERVYKTLPSSTKFIVITCNPTKRTISDYVHEAGLKRRTGSSTGKEDSKIPYRVGKSYEDSVLVNGAVDENNSLITNGLYSSHIIRWTKYFPLGNFYLVDGERFKEDPINELRKIEKFFGLRKFFKDENKYYDREKGFYCPAFPQPECLRNKGQKHPKVSGRVLEILDEYYKPYNQQLEHLFNQSFIWAH